MEIRKRQTESGATLVELEGMLVMGQESGTVESAIERLVKDGKKKVILDLAKVSYVDSSGIGILVGCLGHCKRSGSVMRLIGVQDHLLRIMQIARVDQVLPMDASLEEAEGKLGGLNG
jgi:anti-sigma B factor antagonist